MNEGDKLSGGPSLTCDHETFSLDQTGDVTVPGRSSGTGNRVNTVIWQPGTVILDEYRVEARIGTGGMGAVYRVSTLSEPVQVYAVKTLLATVRDDSSVRRTFMRELRTWVNLPGHTHITPCRFFRTVRDQIVIFSEYIDGGSLHDWIRQGRIRSLRDILDVAIQMARGIQAAHDQRLVHQDIKPANVLMTADGVAKLTDFGLAVAKQHQAGSGEFSGMTPAYCSPEQASDGEITPATDMWSWAVSVMEMFIGSVTWQLGMVAESVLDTLTEQNTVTPAPPAVSDILRGCFRINPADRWSGMDEIAGRLMSLWSMLFNENYTRTVSVSAVRAHPDLSEIAGKGNLLAAGEQLQTAIRLTGRNKSDYRYYLEGGRQHSDLSIYFFLEIYDEICRIYGSLPRCELTQEIQENYALVLAAKSNIHHVLNDMHGAISLSHRAEKILRGLLHRKTDVKWIGNLAGVLGNRANIEMISGRGKAAVELYDEMITLLESRDLASVPSDSGQGLATALINRAMALDLIGDLDRALTDYDRAIGLRKKIAETDPSPATRNGLAGACYARGATLTRAERHSEALGFYEEAQMIRETLVFQENHRVFLNELALTYQNKSISMKGLGDFEGALAILDRSINLRENSMQSSSGDTRMEGLAIAYYNRGNLLHGIGKPEKALTDYARAVSILELLVFSRGRQNILHYLARVNRNQARVFIEMDLPGKAVSVLDNAIKILQRLVEEKGQIRFKGELDTLISMKADLSS